MERRYLRRMGRKLYQDPHSKWEYDDGWVFDAIKCEFDDGVFCINRDALFAVKVKLLTANGKRWVASCTVWNPWAWEARLLRRISRRWHREDRRRQREVWEKRLAEASGVKLLASPDREGLMAEVEQEIEEALEARRITGE